MNLTPSVSVSARINKFVTGRETYKTENGCKVTMKSGTGNITLGNDGVINISGAKDLRQML
mgnify:CR=1 FL=1